LNILVIGCGRVGINLAERLDEHGHDVAIIDADVDRFRALSDTFTGLTICGMPMDMRVIQNAGVENCDAVAVVTSDDNLNITVSQIVKEFFGVENVLARISDPAREKVFQKFGLKTVCPTNLAGDAMFAALTQPYEHKNLTFGVSTVSFTCVPIQEQWAGKDIRKIEKTDDEHSVFGVVHTDGSMDLCTIHREILLQQNDVLIFANLCD